MNTPKFDPLGHAQRTGTSSARFARQPRLASIIAISFAALLSAFAVPAKAQGDAHTTVAEPSGCPPKTPTDDVRDDYFGTIVPDPYRWLEDQTSPQTRAWINAEDRCTDAVLSKLGDRDRIKQRLSELMKVDSISTPIERSGRLFFLKRGSQQDLSSLYMRKSLNGPDELLVDPAPLSKDHSVSITLEDVSDDGTLVFYGVRAGGQDETTIHILNADTHKEMKDVLPHAVYFGIAPTPDDSGVYYARTTAQGPRIFYHKMGADPAADPVIFGSDYGRDKILSVDISPDGGYLLFTVLYGSGIEQTAIYVQNLRTKARPLPIVNDLVSTFYGSIVGDTLYLQTDWKAPMGRLIAVDLKDPARADWRDIVRATDAHLESFSIAGKKLALLYTHEASSQLKLFDMDGSSPRDIPLPSLGTVSGVSSRWGSNILFFPFESFNYPLTIYEANATQPNLTVWAKQPVPIQSDRFDVKQVTYKSKDGTQVPMFLFFKKGIALDGNRPTLMTGYGGFSISETPTFRADAVVWAEEGGVFALPNLRGGGEFGEAWHRAGMMGNKQNVFNDFIAAGEWLVANKYTNPSRLAIMGRSNGGLLMGAAMTQRPDLFRAVVCMYPLLDMLRYQKFLDGPYWVPEYGSSANPQQFKWLYAYSPYQHVKPGVKYPAVLFITGDGDTRVAPLHARKMAARMQADTASGHPALLLYDTKSGHSGGRPLNNEIQENTDILSFLYWQLGVNAH